MSKIIAVILVLLASFLSLYVVWQIHLDVQRVEIQYVFMFMITIPIFFFIYLFFYNEKILSGIKEWGYTKFENGINKAVTERLTTKKDTADFFLKSVILSTVILYVLANVPTQNILILLPVTDLISGTELSCESPLNEFSKIHELNVLILIAFGSFWFFILRYLWMYRIKKGSDKIPGAKSMILFGYFFLAFFIADNFLDFGCEREPGLYLAPDPPSKILLNAFMLSVIYGGPLSIILIILDRYVLDKIFSKN
jgi:hypothetical protein